MKILRRLSGITLILMALGGAFGCGTSTDLASLSNPSTQSVAAIGSVRLQHALARQVSTYVTHFRVTLFDEDGLTVYRRGPLTKEPVILLEEVPVSAVLLQVEYLAGQSLVGTFETEISVRPGEVTEVANPSWVDSAPQTAQFESQAVFLSPKGPISIATADFNVDGNLDLVTANSLSQDVSLLLGRGDGGFNDATTFTTGPVPTTVATGDLNGDGHPDLAVANFGGGDLSGNLAVFLGDGKGGFAHQTIYHPGEGPTGLIFADVDGDGRLDLISTNFREDTLAVFRGRGDGGLEAPVLYSTGVRPRAVTAGDIDGDGTLDLVVANEGITDIPNEEDISVLLGNGDGTFGPTRHFPAHDNPHSVALGDLDGDGHLDLVAANFISNDVSVLSGRGDGGFEAPVNYPVGEIPLSLVLEDFNHDGRLDVAVATGGEGEVWALVGKGDGTFQVPSRWKAGERTFYIVSGDFNLDGRPDAAVANFGSDDVSVLLNSLR